jgi:hypothetical protein
MTPPISCRYREAVIHKIRLVAVAVILQPVVGHVMIAQEGIRSVPPTVPDSARVSSLSFERILNTFLWHGKLMYAGALGGLEVQTQHHLRSRLIRAEQKSVQDEYLGLVNLRTKLDQRWSLQSRLSSSVVSDTRAIDLAKLAQHFGLVGTEYTHGPGMAARLLGGYEFLAQGDERDAGFSYLFQAEGRDIGIEAFEGSYKVRSSQSFVTPRRWSDDSLGVTFDRSFGDVAAARLTVRYNDQRREFYTAADSSIRQRFGVTSNIFKRETQGLEVSNRWVYQPSSASTLLVEGGVQNRTIDRGLRYKDFASLAGTSLDSRVQEFQLFGSLAMTYSVAAWLRGAVQAAYIEREERHTVTEDLAASEQVYRRHVASANRLGNIARRTSLASQWTADISSRDQLNLVGSASILRYDTPDTLNTDDRDELRLTLGVEEVHVASPHLRVSLSANVALTHLVYLHRLQSANNAWNRVIRFSPRVDYTPSPAVRSVNIAEVMANYTAYDFEDQIALVRSFSFRQASWIDSTSIRFSRNTGLEFTGSARVYVRGILRWKEFTERPQNFFVEFSLWPQLVLGIEESVRIGVGYRYFNQDRYRYKQGNRVFDRQIASLGPTVQLGWRHLVTFEGWREVQAEGRTIIRTISNVSMTVMLDF